MFPYKGLKDVSENFKFFLYPFDLISMLSSSISEKIKLMFNVIEENERLKKENIELKAERHLFYEIILEKQRLKKILSLRDYGLNFYTMAKPIAKGYDRFKHTLIIDKGSDEGVKKDMPVITDLGLVGKIYRVRSNFSEVLLLKDPNFSVAVRLQLSRHEGVVVGTGRNYCLIKYISPEETVQKGEAVITSGLDGIFPPGIPVGVVSYIGVERKDFYHYIELLPYQQDSKIEDVIILDTYGNITNQGQGKAKRN
ncbi:MAG: rod shape-determining protein MreC [Thermodesulfovibrionales bacterium]|nr:rod shape-determining protein MreC [Thermodesulfovibrionales bacterium]